MADGYPGDMTQEDIEEQLFQDFLAQVLPGTPAPITMPQATAELLLRLIGTPGAPVVVSLSPTSSTTASQNLSVRGSGFTDTSKVVFDGTEVATTFKSAVALQATVAGSAGTYEVFVRDVSGDSNTMRFEFK